MQPLKGRKVIDLTQALAGPFCSMVLADLGAEVIKVEKPKIGDDSRKMGPPFIEGESASFLAVNRNKKSVSIDLQTEKGVEVFKHLAKDADIVIENFRPGVVDRLGIGYESIKEINEKVIYCSISGFGQTGPYKNKGGFDIISQAFSGIMSTTGEEDGLPVKAGIAVSDSVAGLTAVYGILASLIQRDNTGTGQYLETSLVESTLAICSWESAYYFATKETPKALGSSHRLAAPYQAFKTKDAHIIIGCANQKLWEEFANTLGRKDLLCDQRFKDNSKRVENMKILQDIIENELSVKRSDEWLDILDKAGVPSGPINKFDQIIEDTYLQERDMIIEMEHPKLGKIKNIGNPIKYENSIERDNRPAPYLGENTEQVLQEAGYSTEEVQELLSTNIIYKN
ncbi:CoA transferase [Sporosarcina sp. P3]|uniref:CaiB/BaiF CoA transferase family protein n=1 Tax=Sporosarcina TaxID=1569 RepID=UPI0009DC6489|nr:MULTISPECIES: CoA transferase [Sporosarcina]ARF17798.1 CoA-transferase [Sporosarcina ureae]PID20177.1 CoA transferase [Sporosarcina sp. P3]